MYSDFINDFNKYSKKNNLNIYINLNLVSSTNFTRHVVDYEELLDGIFKKKTKKYDIIFYDNIYKTRFSSNLLDLKKLLPKEHIDMYMEGIANQTCTFKDKIIGLYKRDVPKTWDDLMDTSKYILKMENELYNNTELYSYPGFFPDHEGGIYTFKQNINFYMEQIPKSHLLFFKFWYLPLLFPNYKYVALPGIKEGLSGSVVGGPNVGISIYSEKSKQEAVIKALVFITSKEIQRKYIATQNYYSPIPSLYYEEEVCQKIDCDFFKSIQLVSRPTAIFKDYTKYSNKYRNYIYDFLFGNETISDVLQKIEDISKVYYISIQTTESNVGLIFLMIEIGISVMIIGSLVFLYIKKFNPHFKILPNAYWIVFILGQVLIMEENNKISVWVNRNKYIFLLSFILFDIFICFLVHLTPYNVEDMMFEDEKNYQVCRMKNVFGKIIIYLMYIFKIIIILVSMLLIFIEWNLKNIRYDLHFISISYYSNILLLIGYIFISYINSIKCYKVHFILYQLIHISFSLFGYILVYGIRIVWSIMGNKSNEPSINDIINDLMYMANNKTYVESDEVVNNVNNGNKNHAVRISEMILNYHKKEFINVEENSNSKASSGVKTNSSSTK
eukprot:jgi/Orpsp1_1/1176030/evm.model.c7180000056135.1